MKGAMAELCASSSNAPKMSIVVTNGNSQNFFLVRKNAQSSVTNDIILLLKLIPHRVGRRSSGMPRNPIAVRGGVVFEPEKILAHPAADDSGRSKQQIKHRASDDRIGYFAY